MTIKRWAFGLGVAGAATFLAAGGPGLGAAPGGGRPDGRSQPPTGTAVATVSGVQSILVRFEALATQRDGATGAQSASAGRRLSVGEEYVGYLVAASRANPEACEVGRVTALAEVRAFRIAWRVAASLVAAGDDKATLDVEWTRLASGAPVAPGVRRRLTLGEGEVHVLDLAGLPETGGNSCANVLLRVSAAPSVRPDLARRLLGYEVWVVHEGVGGKRMVARQRDLTGRHGEAVPFHLRPVRWSLAGEAAAEAAAAIEMDVPGTVMGRVLPDGRLSVLLRAAPQVVFGQSAVAGRVTKRLDLSSGETVEVLLPAPAGRVRSDSRQAAAGVSLARGVSFDGAWTVIDLGAFFAGTRTSLLVTVTVDQ